ncbi:MAG: septal ring lytic transglycosylase RlpA family protein, partial [Methylomonas sp.]
MFLNTLLARSGRCSEYTFSWHLKILVVFFSLLGGCAAEPTIQIDEEQVVLPPSINQSIHSKAYRVKGKTYKPMLTAAGYKAKGKASWYGAESGNRTASGGRFDPRGLTAAHKTLPISSKVRVTNLENGRYVDVVINDRGPFVNNRLIDLSKGAAERIGMRGLAEV